MQGHVHKSKTIQAGVFKAQCLKIMDDVERTKMEIIITKHRKPIVKLVPIKPDKQVIFGRMKGMIHIKGDILKPIDEEWDACS